MPHFEIRSQLTGAVIFESDGETLRGVVIKAVSSRADLTGANLSGADLSGADLSWANLSGADLSGADLTGANLSRADLFRANLTRANLTRANLFRADLSGAIGVNPYASTPLLLLLEQPGKIRAYKLVNADGVGPYNGGIKYEIGETYKVADANTDVTEQCGAGINLATLDWCMRGWCAGYRILIAEFEAGDIAAIPTATDGKWRVHRCTIVGEKDLRAIGLIKEPEPEKQTA